MEVLMLVGSLVGGFYLGKWFPLPELENRWKMFFLRAFVIFAILQVGHIFFEYRHLFWAAIFGYIWKGFRYSSGLKKREEPTSDDPKLEPRTFPKPPVGKGKKKRK
jgi:hypothetical protein